MGARQRNKVKGERKRGRDRAREKLDTHTQLAFNFIIHVHFSARVLTNLMYNII